MSIPVERLHDFFCGRKGLDDISLEVEELRHKLKDFNAEKQVLSDELKDVKSKYSLAQVTIKQVG